MKQRYDWKIGEQVKGRINGAIGTITNIRGDIQAANIPLERTSIYLEWEQGKGHKHAKHTNTTPNYLDYLLHTGGIKIVKSEG